MFSPSLCDKESTCFFSRCTIVTRNFAWSLKCLGSDCCRYLSCHPKIKCCFGFVFTDDLLSSLFYHYNCNKSISLLQSFRKLDILQWTLNFIVGCLCSHLSRHLLYYLLINVVITSAHLFPELLSRLLEECSTTSLFPTHGTLGTGAVPRSNPIFFFRERTCFYLINKEGERGLSSFPHAMLEGRGG